MQLAEAEELAAQAREIQDERDAMRHHEERARRLESAVQMYAKQVCITTYPVAAKHWPHQFALVFVPGQPGAVAQLIR